MTTRPGVPPSWQEALVCVGFFFLEKVFLLMAIAFLACHPLPSYDP